MSLAKKLAFGYVATIVGVGIWAAVDPKGMMGSARKGRKKVEDTTGLRLPRPDIVVLGPAEGEEFEDFDIVLCETAIEVKLEQPTLFESDQNAFVEVVAQRTLAKMLPEYPWPAASGDHTTAAELQGMVKYEIRRSIFDGTLCLSEDDLEVEYDETEEDFVPPPAGEQV